MHGFTSFPPDRDVCVNAVAATTTAVVIVLQTLTDQVLPVRSDGLVCPSHHISAARSSHRGSAQSQAGTSYCPTINHQRFSRAATITETSTVHGRTANGVMIFSSTSPSWSSRRRVCPTGRGRCRYGMITAATLKPPHRGEHWIWTRLIPLRRCCVTPETKACSATPLRDTCRAHFRTMGRRIVEERSFSPSVTALTPTPSGSG